MEPIAEQKFKEIIENAPSDMMFPMYFGVKDGVAIYKDLKDMKSVAMFGDTGISAKCYMPVYSMFLSRAAEFEFCTPVLVCAPTPVPIRIDEPIINEYICDARVGMHSLIYEYQGRKNMESEKNSSQYYEKHPKVYIFDGYCGPLQKDILEGSKVDIAEAQEALENAYKYGLYVIITNNIRPGSKLTESIHTRVQMCFKEPNISIEQGDNILTDIECGWIEQETFSKLLNDNQWPEDRRITGFTSELLDKAIDFSTGTEYVSVGDLQREFVIGYNTALMLIHLLRKCGILEDEVDGKYKSRANRLKK